MHLRLTAWMWVAAAMMASGAEAATISSVSAFSTPGFSTGTLGPVGSTPAPNNDDVVGASPNVIPYSVFFNSPGLLETEFVLANSGGATEYRFTQTFINNTPNAVWSGFRFELGFGTGANFVASKSADGLQFDTLAGQSTGTSSRFSVVVDQPDVLEWNNGSAPRISVTTFSFAIDVPDGLAGVNPGAVNRFTLRQSPVLEAAVPEPATMGLIGIALAGLGLCRRRRLL